MVTACSDTDSIQKVRRSIAFALFFIYATYLIGLLFSHVSKDQARKKNLKRYAQDTAYKTVFFTIFAILARSAAPYVLQSVFTYIYFVVSVLTFLGYFADSKGLRTIGVIAQPVTVLVFALSVLIDDWCSLFY